MFKLIVGIGLIAAGICLIAMVICICQMERCDKVLRQLEIIDWHFKHGTPIEENKRVKK